MLIRFFKTNAKFVDLGDFFFADEGKGFQAFIHFTFDDVSTSFLEQALPIIEKHQIPVTLFVCAKNAEEGYSWRDKIYYLLNHADLLNQFIQKSRLLFGDRADRGQENPYQWSKQADLNQRLLENQVIDEVLDSQTDDFHEQVNEFRPYLNWEELKQIASHPLIVIGNHGMNHYNYNSLPEREIEDDIIESHRLIEQRMGIQCRHFAIPFGAVGQKSFLTVDRVLTRLNYDSAAWVKRVNNPRIPGEALKHYFRIDSGRNLLINFVKFCKAYVKTQYSPLSGIPLSSYHDPRIKIDLVTEVSREEYKTFFRRSQPHKSHHQNDGYINHLYYENPFRGQKPIHFALKANGDIYSIGSLFHVPFLLKGEKKEGAYFCGWYRFPEFPAESLRARRILEETQKVCFLTGAYHPSSDSLHFYDSWNKVKVYRLTAKLKRKRKAHYPHSAWIMATKWDPKLQRIIDASQNNLLLSIKRGEELYNWRIDKYPLCDFFYFYPKVPNPDWYLIFCEHKNTLYISDFCLASLDDKKLISEMFHYLLDYCLNQEIQKVIMETSNRHIQEVARKNRFKIFESFLNVYYYPEATGKEIHWEKVHETQISGDLLPRLNDSARSEITQK